MDYLHGELANTGSLLLSDATVVSFRLPSYLRPTSPSSLLVLLMQHGGELFFGAFFAPPAIPSVVTFRAALALSTAYVPLLSSRAAYAVRR